MEKDSIRYSDKKKPLMPIPPLFFFFFFIFLGSVSSPGSLLPFNSLYLNAMYTASE